MKTLLEYRHNHGYDSVVLVDIATNRVLSHWTVNQKVMREFCDCTHSHENWEDRGGDKLPPKAYGRLLAYREGYALSAMDSDKWAECVESFCH